MNQVRTAMQLAVSLGRQIYSFHAGFRIDPKVSELGNKFSNSQIMDRELALNHFTGMNSSSMKLAMAAPMKDGDILMPYSGRGWTKMLDIPWDPLKVSCVPAYRSMAV